MPTPPQKRPDRHYDFTATNKLFALSSLALLATTAWMVIDDYNKPWKRFQSEFRDRERQTLSAEADAERQSLNQEEIAQIQQEIATEGQQVSEQAAELEALAGEISGLEDQIYVADSEFRMTKAVMDTAKYQLDMAVQQGGEALVAERRQAYEDLASKLHENQKTLEAYREDLGTREDELKQRFAGRDAANDRLGSMQADLASLEERAGSLEKNLDYMVLNFPLMDFLEPSIKVEQVMLTGLYQDNNFTEVDRVDRCVTCHVASNRAGFDGEEWELPFRSHPRFDMFVSDSSPHPYSTFGCTTCHRGLDRATDFSRVGHSPSDAKEQARWEDEYSWEEQHYLEMPLLPSEFSEAGCLTCHAGGAWTSESQHLDTGRQLMSRMGCFGCHVIDYPAFNDLPRPGPNLNNVKAKIDEGWAYKWIEAPREFRASTWMPHFFYQENIVGDLNEARQSVEIASIVRFLWANSGDSEYPAPPRGNGERGQELFETVGCTGCHLLDSEATRDDYFPQINRLHGPNLISTGSKVDAGWLFAWLKNPKQYNPDTRMPSLRLTDREAADITAYLMSSRDENYQDLEIPAIDGDARDGLVLGYLRSTQTIEQSQATLESMSDLDRDVFLGENTVRKYGCFACHDIAGFEDAKPIGVELTAEGSKPIHQFDFGHVHDVPHTRHDWIKTKMLQPRIWDQGKESVKTYAELYKMPNFGMSEREAAAVTTNVLGFSKSSVVASRKAGFGTNVEALAAGRNLITKYNCQGCHLIEGEGHAIKTSIEDVGMLPPNLASQGARVQTPWLFDYLHDPSTETMRPWLSVRMPTFDFSDEEVNAITGYFNMRDQRETFLSAKGEADRRDLAVGGVVFDMLQCARCHPAGESAQEGVSSSELAPSLLMAAERLRHDWVPEWIMDPQAWVPGTRMPANFQKLDDGSFQSPLVNAIAAPMFAGQKRDMMRYFDSEQELLDYLGDVERVAGALREHIWTLN